MKGKNNKLHKIYTFRKEFQKARKAMEAYR